ncbi:MAG: hypothetical protein IKH30_20305 [Clostridia bacterium]|nr:hypothetical protein [Clostridia bacterium]
MKKWIVRVISALLLCVLLAGASAEVKVHINQTPPADWQERDLLRLIVFKVTPCDAMVLQCGGESMMIDSSTRSSARVLEQALKDLGYGNTEDGHVHMPILFNTHPHDDHLQGFWQMVRNGMTTDLFITSFPAEYRNEMQQTALKEFTGRGIPIHILEQNEEMTLGGAKLRFFWYSGGKDPNELSCCTRVEFGETSILLTGDAVGMAQHGLLDQVPHEWLKADILKSPHHSYTIMVKEFLDVVSPLFVFSSNTMYYAQTTQNQVEAHGAKFATSASGRIVLETDGNEWYIYQMKGET